MVSSVVVRTASSEMERGDCSDPDAIVTHETPRSACRQWMMPASARMLLMAASTICGVAVDPGSCGLRYHGASLGAGHAAANPSNEALIAATPRTPHATRPRHHAAANEKYGGETE